MKYMVTYFREVEDTKSINTEIVEWDKLSEENIRKFCSDYKFIGGKTPAAILNIIQLDDK